MLSVVIIVSLVEMNEHNNAGNATKSEEKQIDEIAGTTTTGADRSFLSSSWCPWKYFSYGCCKGHKDCISIVVADVTNLKLSKRIMNIHVLILLRGLQDVLHLIINYDCK
ncbi:hypothetical protein PV328_011240 [Microctonus aethiopoides]|uniref:Uncharacterized protein n=1 Tax=Microctonus aethiopoides TaxID=144406 RepID=A0AA39EXP6_9HYME|nr:hypothetical protein PV328_011240 [Microctonus aethiopoides]